MKFNDKVGEKGSAETDFSVVSYNILADCHMKPDWYDIMISFVMMMVMV